MGRFRGGNTTHTIKPGLPAVKLTGGTFRGEVVEGALIDSGGC